MAEEPESTANDELVAAALILALLVDRYAIGLQNAAGMRLARLRSDLIGLIARNDPTAPSRLTDRANRLRKALEESNALIKAAYIELNRDMRTALRTLTDLVEEATVRQARNAVGADIFTRRSEPAEQRSLADNTVIMGAVLKTWLERHAGDLQFRIYTALQDLAVRERPLEEMLDVVRGDEQQSGANGAVGLSIKRLAVLIGTAVHAVANKVRDALFRANPQAIGAILHISILDEKTTKFICRPRHMRRWTLDGEPIGHKLPYLGTPPLHWFCRSATVPVLVDYNSLPARIKRQVRPERFTDTSPREPTEPPRNNDPIDARTFRREI